MNEPSLFDNSEDPSETGQQAGASITSDLERVQRCCIHYAVPDGRIIPFCTMNSIHREKVEKDLSIPLDEWRREHKAEVSVVA